MIEKLTTEKIPEWAICYFWNGDIGELDDEEIKAMQKWESDMIQYAKDKHPRSSSPACIMILLTEKMRKRISPDVLLLASEMSMH